MFSRFLILFIVLALPWYGSDVSAQDGHDHVNEQKSEDKSDSHEGHDHNDNDESHEETGDHESEGRETHDSELTVELSKEAVKLAGIKVSTVQHGFIDKKIDLPGEIGFNEDRVAHIAPRFEGIAIEAKFRVGDFVNEGDIVAVIESNESMNAYAIKAPISGWIIERHITPGEYVSGENSIYVIVDLSTVWVNLAVYPKDAEQVKKGQTVEINLIGSRSITSGKIEYITPIVDLRTRSLTAKVTLSNPDNIWRPGSFVQGTITTGSGNKSIVVKKSAVQYLDEKSVIFVVESPYKFKPVEIEIGDSDQSNVQVLSDIPIGTNYVSEGAFELKAKIVTSNLDAHAGHGH